MPIRYLDEQPSQQPKGKIRFLDEQPVTQPQARAGSPAEAFGLGLAGGQIPFGNVITSRLAAEATAPFLQQDGESWRDAASRLYDEAQAYTKATQEENPKATLAGNITGAISTIPSAFSKGGGSGLGGIRGAVTTGTEKAGEYAEKMAGFSPFSEKGLGAAGNILTRFAGRTAVAAPVAGLYAAGDANSGERGEAFKSGATMGAVASAAFPVAGAAIGAGYRGVKNIAKGITARAPEVLDDALMRMKDFSRGLYRQSESAGAILTPQAAQKISQSVSNIVKNANTGASQTLYNKTLGAIQGLNDDLAQGNTGLEVLDAHRQILGNLAKDITNPNRAQEAEAAGRAIDAIDDIIENLSPADIQNQSREAIESLLQARQVWSQSKKFEKISDIVKNSGGDANKLKRDLERFASNAKNTLGWNKEELDALKFAGQQTTGEGLLKMIGKFGFDLGSGRAVGNTGLPVIGGVLGGGAGALAGGASGAAIPAAAVVGVGTAARQGQKYLARGKAEMLLQALEKSGNSPQVTQQTTPTLGKKLANALGVSRAGIAVNPKAAQLVKGYIADESGAVKMLPSSESLRDTRLPSLLEMKKLSKIDRVPLNRATTSQTKMEWDKFNNKKYSGPLFEGFSDKPVAIKMNNGEYRIIDGNHRSVSSINKGDKELDMYVINASDFDPVNAGVKNKEVTKKEIEDLLNELLK